MTSIAASSAASSPIFLRPIFLRSPPCYRPLLPLLPSLPSQPPTPIRKANLSTKQRPQALTHTVSAWYPVSSFRSLGARAKTKLVFLAVLSIIATWKRLCGLNWHGLLFALCKRDKQTEEELNRSLYRRSSLFNMPLVFSTRYEIIVPTSAKRTHPRVISHPSVLSCTFVNNEDQSNGKGVRHRKSLRNASAVNRLTHRSNS